MTARSVFVVASFLLSIATALVLRRGPEASADSRTPSSPGKAGSGFVVGLSMDSLQEARWQKDKEYFESQVAKMGGRTVTLSANSDDTVQVGDIEKLITQKVSVLVVVPHDGKVMAKAVELAHEANIPVIAYDRIIKDSDLDLYVSFDNFKVGAAQAQFVIDHLPTPGKGKIVRVNGSKTDNNAFLFRAGQDSVLDPYVKRGDIVVVRDDWADGWKPEIAKQIVNAAITDKIPFDAVLAMNDGTAGGSIQALSEAGLAGKVLVTGQDAELVACQRIVAGTQSMTVYKPILKLATSAGEAAGKLALHKPVIAAEVTNNGKIDVPSILNDVIVVTAQNIRETVVKDGFCPEAEVYGAGK